MAKEKTPKEKKVKKKEEVEDEEEVVEEEEETTEEGEEADEENSDEEDSDEEDEEDDEEAKDEVDVIKGKQYIRTFSKAIHGKDFKKLAEEFVSNPNYVNRGYSIDKDGLLSRSRLVVRYREKADAEKPLDKQKPDSPEVDKEKVFSNRQKEEALAFAIEKRVSVSQRPTVTIIPKKEEKKREE